MNRIDGSNRIDPIRSRYDAPVSPNDAVSAEDRDVLEGDRLDFQERRTSRLVVQVLEERVEVVDDGERVTEVVEEREEEGGQVVRARIDEFVTLIEKPQAREALEAAQGRLDPSRIASLLEDR